MKRYVYSPKVEAFIRSDDTAQTVDVSDDIISGTVTRRLNAMSTASLVLQNKNGKYSNRFNPMDRIIIFLTRQKRTLVFTGFVDDAPYYQLYPGPVTVSASCTLKLLQHTYFDPGLPYFTQWLKQFGWDYIAETGAVWDRAGAVGNLDLRGGVGHIIRESLVQIAGWPKEGVIIKEMPDDFIKGISELMVGEAEEVAQNVLDLQDNLRSLLTVEGIEELTGGDPIAPPSVSGNISPVDMAKLARSVGWKGNNVVIAVAVAMAESGLRSDAKGGPNRDNTFDHGLFQINAIHFNSNINGVVVGEKTVFDPVLNAKIAYGLWKNNNSWQPWSAFNNGRYKQFLPEAQKAVREASGAQPLPEGTDASRSARPGVRKSEIIAADRTVQPPYYPLARTGENGQRPYGGGTHVGSWEDAAAFDISIPFGTAVIAVEDGVIGDRWGHLPGSGSCTPYPKGHSSYSGRYGGCRLHLFVGGQDKYYYAHLSKITVPPGTRVKAGDIIGLSGQANGVDHLHFAMNVPNTPAGIAAVTAAVRRPTVKGQLPAAGSVVNAAGDTYNSTQAGVLSGDQTAAISRQSYWFMKQITTTQANPVLSKQLAGRRALANDIPLMEWITNLVPTSGRVFCSAPNGDFYAFHPDYFGYFKRTPYFYISDMEVIELNMQKSDQELTTHVFATGNILGDPTEVWKLSTSVVASVQEPAFNKFINVNPDDATLPNRNDFDSTKFLERYGARPMLHDMPTIRHPVLIWIGAWMKFADQWSKRFKAEGSFTFMPELFPGGLVAFGDRITMFVEEVTHTFDLSSGFSTSASLSAPAALDGSFDSMVWSGTETTGLYTAGDATRHPHNPAGEPETRLPLGD